MIARVFAAFLSFFESAAIFFFLDNGGFGDVSIVGGSGSKPLWYEVFSGDVFVELTVVKAVVVSVKDFYFFVFILSAIFHVPISFNCLYYFIFASWVI